MALKRLGRVLSGGNHERPSWGWLRRGLEAKRRCGLVGVGWRVEELGGRWE